MNDKEFNKIYLGRTYDQIEDNPVNIPNEAKKGMYYICAIIKDEHDYIREWVLHNISIGFDKIVLYDNNSSKPYDDMIGDLILSGFVEMRIWTDNRWSRQSRVYNDFVWGGKWGNEDYCAFIDPDEFIFFDNVKTISEFMNLYSEFAGVGLSWRLYNANGRIEAPKEIPTPKAYSTEFEYKEPRIKVIGRLKDIKNFPTVHNFIPGQGELVTTAKQPIYGMHWNYIDFTNGHIKHYITKSWQDWVKKLKRGNITKGLRTVDIFFKFNPDLAHMRYELTKNLDFDEFPTLYDIDQIWDGD